MCGDRLVGWLQIRWGLGGAPGQAAALGCGGMSGPAGEHGRQRSTFHVLEKLREKVTWKNELLYVKASGCVTISEMLVAVDCSLPGKI